MSDFMTLANELDRLQMAAEDQDGASTPEENWAIVDLEAKVIAASDHSPESFAWRLERIRKGIWREWSAEDLAPLLASLERDAMEVAAAARAIGRP